eukprot:COSAG06_NODE_5397_length_3506_cov_144.148518_3_plen_71_part_00
MGGEGPGGIWRERAPLHSRSMMWEMFILGAGRWERSTLRRPRVEKGNPSATGCYRLLLLLLTPFVVIATL